MTTEDESKFLSEIGMMLSDAMYSEPELVKKARILEQISKKITQRLIDTQPPGTILMA